MDFFMPPLEVLPDYLPARMLNEFVYCPRLFYYEWVEGVFADNRETVEGSLRHAKLDSHTDELAPAGELAPEDHIHARSVTLSSDAHKLIAKIDLVEADGRTVTPVDYKHGSPRKDCDTGELEAWDPDRVQLAVQAIVLRDNGYSCEEGVIYYVATKQRVRVPISDDLVAMALEKVTQALAAGGSDKIPPPLVDSPKCPRCSLVGICLPDETLFIQEAQSDHTTELATHNPQLTTRKLFVQEAQSERTTELTTHNPQLPIGNGDGEFIASATERPQPRRLVAARDDLRPLYLNSQGLYVGKSGNVLKVKEKEKVIQEVRLVETCQVNLFGNIQLTTQAIQTLCQGDVPICYFSQGGWFYGITHGLGVRNIALRREQFRLAEDPEFCLRIARSLVAGKIRNQRTMLQRNHVEPPADKIAQMKCLCDDAERAESFEQLLGLEGNGARIYFELFSGMIKTGDPATSRLAGGKPELSFDFTHRNRRPPRDPVNALLSLAYSVLAKDMTIVCHSVGFDAFLGFYHQPRFGRAALPLDLMEPFRPLIADSAVLSAINTKMVVPGDFVRAGQSVALNPDGRKAFFRAYEQRMDTLVTHPLFGYRLNYRRMLEIQTRLLARVVTGEIDSYPVFVTR
jgi:CRISPR-associated protein Cas1